MILFKTIKEIQEFLKVDVTTNFNSISPFIADASNKYIKEILGTAQYDELNTWYNTTPLPVNAKLTALLPKVQNALAKFTYYIAAPFLDLKNTEMGFVVSLNQNMAPASKERVKKYVDSLEALGYDNFETLLIFMEENKANYPLWVASDAYTLATKNLINSAIEFNLYVNINNSRLTFKKLRQTIDNVDILTIQPAISVNLFDAIITEIKAGNISTANAKILTLLKRAEANFAFFSENKDNRFENLGNHYLTAVKKIIDATPDDYPLYRDSDVYYGDRENYETFENSEDYGFFVSGTNIV